MKIFITGATGFIGRHLLTTLEKTKYEIRSHIGTNIKKDIQWAQTLKCEWNKTPLDRLTEKDFENVHVLIHLACAGVSPKICTWSELFYWNVKVFVDMLQTAKNAGVSKFIIVGSCLEYGKTADEFEYIPPTAPLQPCTPYAASKAASAMASSAFAINEKVEVIYSRIFSVYGENQNENNLYPALRKAFLEGKDFEMTKGEQIRDFISVGEVVHKITSNIERQDIRAGFCKFENIATGIPTTVFDFAQKWWRAWNASGSLLPGSISYRSDEIMRIVGKV